MSKYLDYREAADLLGLKVATLYSKVSRKEIPHIRLSPRLVRFERSALEAWIASCRVSPQNEALVHRSEGGSAGDR